MSAKKKGKGPTKLQINTPSLADRIEKRAHLVVDNAHSRGELALECPYCKRYVIVGTTQLRTRGERCECGALCWQDHAYKFKVTP